MVYTRIRLSSVSITHLEITMSRPYSAICVANTIIRMASEFGIEDLSPMKLQKLIYYSHAWHLAVCGNSLISEPVEAWTYGPVIKEIYHEFKHYGSNKIKRPATELDFTNGDFKFTTQYVPDEDAQSLDIIRQVLAEYGKFSAIQLANLTHRDKEPWKAIADKYSGELDRHVEIPNSMIQHYFQALLPE